MDGFVGSVQDVCDLGELVAHYADIVPDVVDRLSEGKKEARLCAV